MIDVKQSCSSAIETIGVDIIDFDTTQAIITAELRAATKSAGLSLGDRACLALAQTKNLPALTADQAWRHLPLPITVIRPG